MPITPCKDKNGKPIKKDGLQKYRVRVRYTAKRTDGTPEYKVVERTAYGKAEAMELEKELMQLANKTTVAPSDAPQTVRELAEEYLSRMLTSNAIRESSHAKKTSVLNNHVLPILGDYKLGKLNQHILLAWQDEINKKPIGLKMKQLIYADLRAMMNYAVKLDYIPVSPLSKVENFRDANSAEHPEEKMQFYTAEQYHRFDAVLSKDQTVRGKNLRIFFAVLFYTGCRKGEAQALKWSDYDGASVWIRRSISQKISGKRITETPPKNQSSYRKISIPEPLKHLLSEQLNRQKNDPSWTADWRICGGPDVISDTTVSNCNKKTAEAANLPPIRVHDFRHSHASLLINAGINIKAISARLGHSTVEQTWNRYGHLYPEQDNRILSVLNET